MWEDSLIEHRGYWLLKAHGAFMEKIVLRMSQRVEQQWEKKLIILQRDLE